MKKVQIMNALKKTLIAVFALVSLTSNGQSKKAASTQVSSDNIIFKDTLFNIAFDSITHNLGLIEPTNKNNRVVQHFKYVGTDTIFIARAWTGDPHYICEYPNEPLVPDTIYSYTICFWHKGRQGRMNKRMGFLLSNGNRIILKFKGEYSPVENK